MCGIVGYIGDINDDILARLQAAFGRDPHRGPELISGR